MEVALAIELLTMTALRVKNLARLNLDENVHWTQSSKRVVCRLVDRRHVKNRVDRDFKLKGQTAELLKLFLETSGRSSRRPGVRGCLPDAMEWGRSTRLYLDGASRRHPPTHGPDCQRPPVFALSELRSFSIKIPEPVRCPACPRPQALVDDDVGLRRMEASKLFDLTLQDRREDARARPKREARRSRR